MITDLALAQEIVDRLNALIQEPDARVALELLIGTRVLLPDSSLAVHPTIQVGRSDDSVNPSPAGRIDLGFLGMLNGIVGVIPIGKRKGYGYISGQMEDDRLIGFQLTEQ